LTAISAIADLRTLVYSLRPPALDELGLVGSLQEACRRLGDRPEVLRISVRSDADQLDLPADVEVAVYAIATEAVTNMLRHSSARNCEVSLDLTDPGTGPAERNLTVRVSDDGIGLSEPEPRGGRPGHDAGACRGGRRPPHVPPQPARRPRGGSGPTG
jgi:signal transduction histidine kinase